MRTTTAYFAGVGTVVAAVAVGLGGGLLISNIVSPHEPRVEMSKLELRMSKPIPVSNAPSEPVPYVAATRAIPSAADTVQAEPRRPAPTPPSETVAANNPSPPPDIAPPAPPAPREQAVAPEDAFAKARDADAKRVTEKRKAERRQQWTERRRRHLQRQDQELREVEEKVREETGPRQAFTVEPARLEMPRIRLFENE